MTKYQAHVEVDESGMVMVHVLSLPGCFTRSTDRDDALFRALDAVRCYMSWLRSHGERVATGPIDVEAVTPDQTLEEGPFHPGGAAAMFEPDRVPVTDDDLDRHFQLMAYSRADLVALVKDLPDRTLDLQLDSKSLSIRRALRHLGNVEQWYVSRLVDPSTLPREWADDESMPILDFLTMERTTAIERLRHLSEYERSEVIRSPRFTSHPDEPWTARKVLRRFLEHEIEHTGQILRILALAHR